MLASLPLLVFPFCMMAAAISDARRFIIPNTLSIALVAGFFVAFALSGLGWAALANHLAAGTVMLLIGVALFAFNIAGAGDGKLLAAAALWMGYPGFVPALVYVCFAGGALSLFIVLAWVFLRWYPRLSVMFPKLADLAAKPLRGLPAPYGVAIAVGAVLAFPQSPIFKALVIGF